MVLICKNCDKPIIEEGVTHLGPQCLCSSPVVKRTKPSTFKVEDPIPLTTKFHQDCLAEKTAEQIRKQRGLSPGTPVPVMISCPCPRCTPRF